jgi:hypothetical protein
MKLLRVHFAGLFRTLSVILKPKRRQCKGVYDFSQNLPYVAFRMLMNEEDIHASRNFMEIDILLSIFTTRNIETNLKPLMWSNNTLIELNCRNFYVWLVN